MKKCPLSLICGLLVSVLLIESCKKEEVVLCQLDTLDESLQDSIAYTLNENPNPIWYDSLDLNNDNVPDLLVHFSEQLIYDETNQDVIGANHKAFLSSLNDEFRFSLGTQLLDDEYGCLILNDDISLDLTWLSNAFMIELSSSGQLGNDSLAVWTTNQNEGYVAVKWEHSDGLIEKGWLKGYYSQEFPWLYIEEIAIASTGIDSLAIGQIDL